MDFSHVGLDLNSVDVPAPTDAHIDDVLTILQLNVQDTQLHILVLSICHKLAAILLSIFVGVCGSDTKTVWISRVSVSVSVVDGQLGEPWNLFGWEEFIISTHCSDRIDTLHFTTELSFLVNLPPVSLPLGVASPLHDDCISTLWLGLLVDSKDDEQENNNRADSKRAFS